MTDLGDVIKPVFSFCSNEKTLSTMLEDARGERLVKDQYVQISHCSTLSKCIRLKRAD
jgi:hypothetical protein